MIRSRLLLAGMALACVVSALVLPAAAQVPASGGPRLQPLQLPEAVDATMATLAPLAAELRELGDPQQLVTVMVDVAGDPLVVARAAAARRGQALSAPEMAALRQELDNRQSALAGEIQALGGVVLSRLQDAYNGLRVQIRAGQVDEVAALPAASRVRPLEIFELSNADALPAVGAPQVWEQHGLTGADVSIAVIDSGVDYLHATFGGPGTEESYEDNDPEVAEAGSFPTAKVVGGYDFVGDDFEPGSDNPALNRPRPDGDPLDCNGHGTHVAGTAAGLGVTADGRTYAGPYEADTLAGASFAVGPGVAPQADLYALKVFGCAGTTNVVVDAINWAVANDVDVINLSLGSTFGRSDDPSSIAANNAALAGVVVITAAGNSGHEPYATGAPAAAEAAVSVAAVDGRAGIPAAELQAESATVTLQRSNDAGLDEDVSGPLHVLQDAAGTAEDESLGCEEDDYAEVAAGAVVVAWRGVCPRADRAVLGQAAGAAAVVMVNDTSGYPPPEGVIDGVEIPFLGARQEDGGRLRTLHGLAATVQEAGALPNPVRGAPAGFTSGGPGAGSNAAKPDVAAPGVGIRSAAAGTGTGARVMSGTSMAAPQVAGLAALVRQQRPDWQVDAVKAAIVNTARPHAAQDHNLRLSGAGMVDAAAAVATTVVATGDPLTASLSFGLVEGSTPVSRTKTVTVHNRGTQVAAFEASGVLTDDAGGAGEVTVRPSSFVVAPGAARRLTVTMSMDLPAVPPGFATIAGLVELRRPGGARPGEVRLRVPFLALPRAVSALATAPDRVQLPAEAEAEVVQLTTSNRAAVAGSYEVYAWGLSDGAGESIGADLRAVGVLALPDAEPAEGKHGLGVFAVNLHDATSTFSGSVVVLPLDTDGDVVVDHAIVGVDASALGGPAGMFASVVLRQPSGRVVAAYPALAQHNTSTVRLPFALSDVGLSEDDAEFTYTAAVVRSDADDELDDDVDLIDGQASFDAYDQPVETGHSGQLSQEAVQRWTAAVDGEQLERHAQRGWMLVYPDNPGGQESAQLVPLVEP